jgi:predicted N-acetyltransferase YhbS
MNRYPIGMPLRQNRIYNGFMIVIRRPESKDDFKAYYALRYRVLREPWGQARGTEKDDYEPLSQHLMAVDDESGDVVGVIKWMEKEPGVACLSHLAIAPERQKQGIGQLLVQSVEDAARGQGFAVIGVHSRLTSTDFFERSGYQIKGLPDHFFSTIQLVWMEKKL